MKTTLNKIAEKLQCSEKGCKNEVVVRINRPVRMYADLLVDGKWDEIHSSDDYDNDYDNIHYIYFCAKHGDEKYPFLYIEDIIEDHKND